MMDAKMGDMFENEVGFYICLGKKHTLALYPTGGSQLLEADVAIYMRRYSHTYLGNVCDIIRKAMEDARKS